MDAEELLQAFHMAPAGVWLREATKLLLGGWWTRGSPRYQVLSLGHLMLDTSEELRTEWGPQGQLSQQLGQREERQGGGARWFSHRQEFLVLSIAEVQKAFRQ